MCKWMFVFGTLATFAWSQQPALAPARSSAPQLEKGVVDGKTYKNPSLGLEFAPDPKLTLGAPELTGKPGAAPSSVRVAAWGHLERTRIEGAMFSALALAYYPEDQRSTDACMRRLIRANWKDGFKPLQGIREGELGRVSFARTDFFKEGPAYETVFVKACDAQALVFVFVGSSLDATNKIIADTELKLDLVRSGCAPNANATANK
jgi:hypothetical protein